jgi:drug/metabolite transporter (DMT)-like permease
VVPILLAAVSAVVWGTADFSGGKASQRAVPLAVTVVSQVLGLPMLVLCVALVPGVPAGVDLAWGAAAGVAGLGGVVLLYRALAGGAMAVAAPITAVTAVLIPMGVGLLLDRTPGTLALTGAALAVVAIALVSVGPSGGSSRVTARLVGLALAAGALFGLFFALIAQSSAEAGMWSLLAVRFSSITLGIALMVQSRTSFRLAPAVLPWAALAGLLDVGANALYLAAVTRGHLSIVAAIASLYPVSTVLLAVAIDRERLRPIQVAGLGLAATALVLATT